jgi:hypothetical protein
VKSPISTREMNRTSFNVTGPRAYQGLGSEITAILSMSFVQIRSF